MARKSKKEMAAEFIPGDDAREMSIVCVECATATITGPADGTMRSVAVARAWSWGATGRHVCPRCLAMASAEKEQGHAVAGEQGDLFPGWANDRPCAADSKRRRRKADVPIIVPNPKEE